MHLRFCRFSQDVLLFPVSSTLKGEPILTSFSAAKTPLASSVPSHSPIAAINQNGAPPPPPPTYSHSRGRRRFTMSGASSDQNLPICETHHRGILVQYSHLNPVGQNKCNVCFCLPPSVTTNIARMLLRIQSTLSHPFYLESPLHVHFPLSYPFYLESSFLLRVNLCLPSTSWHKSHLIRLLYNYQNVKCTNSNLSMLAKLKTFTTFDSGDWAVNQHYGPISVTDCRLFRVLCLNMWHRFIFSWYKKV